MIYQTFVSPGAFEIRDLYPTSNSGDLYVTIEENDGSKHSYVVPYSAVPILQREGQKQFVIKPVKYAKITKHKNLDLYKVILFMAYPMTPLSMAVH